MKYEKIMKIVLLLLFALILLTALIVMIGKVINAIKYKIRKETGVQKTEYITLGGIEQYIQIRGKDISNPVIIMVHGGPGNNMAYYSYGWQSDIEQDYTIVNWDQRGCGNTYYRNTNAPNPTLNLMISDLDELVDYICTEYDKEKVIIMGHSWGTFLGGVYAGKHPEKVSAYVAVGQSVDFMNAEQESAKEAIRFANTLGKTEDAQKISQLLESVKNFEKFDKTTFTEFMEFRMRKEKYLPTQFGNRMLWLRIFSPNMTVGDLKWMFNYDQLIESYEVLLYEIFLSEDQSSMYFFDMQYEVPVIMMMGELDWTTPYSEALRYFNNLSAPRKEFITIKNTGHIPFVDQPKEFSEELLKVLG